MPDPTSPPAIVRPVEDYADRLNAIMAEALAFGRKTIEQKVACGRKLAEAKDELEKRNALATSPKDRLPWPKLLKRFGFSVSTARRLMVAFRSHNRSFNLNHPLDAIYDDGVDPTLTEGQKPCRECRMRGKEFDPKCRVCRALNRPVKPPKDDKPLVDEDGKLVPEALHPAWLDAQTIRAFNRDLLALGKVVNGLVERPGCAGIPAEHFHSKLKALCASIWAYRPGFICDGCGGQGCPKCQGRGWRPAAVVRGERAAEKAREWKEKQARSNQPIPE